MADCSVKIWRPKWYQRTGWRLAAIGIVGGFAIGTIASQPDRLKLPAKPVARSAEPVQIIRPEPVASSRVSYIATAFGGCSSAAASDCVIDGDTFRYRGETIRIADIDAPETGGARCESEAQLGARATRRLSQLLSQGDFKLVRYESRDRDQYGRLLRIVERDGASLGQALVTEGMARRLEGRRRPWC